MALITLPNFSGGGGSVTLPQNLGVTDSPTFRSMNTTTTLSVGTSMNVGTSLTVGILSGMIFANAGTLAAATLGDGQILVGKSGQTAPLSLYLTGVGISVTQTSTAIQLSLPQDFSTDASPTFGGITLGGPVSMTGLGTGTGTALIVTTGGQVLQLTSSLADKQDIVSAGSVVNPWSLLSLDSKYYGYKSDPSVKCFGYIAEDLEKVAPELVTHKDGKPYSILYTNFVPLIVDILKEHDSKLAKLTASAPIVSLETRPVVKVNRIKNMFRSMFQKASS